MLSPQPRFRIYSKFSNYIDVAQHFAFKKTRSTDEISRLEKQIALTVNSPYAVAMPTARTAIYLAIKALTRPGQEVILSPLTIVDVVNMVICAGAKPVFADIDRATCNISAEQVKKLINRNTGAVLVTHLHGLACDIKAIAALCKAQQVPLIEDAAQAFASMVDHQYVGTFGDVGIFSFGMYKIINAFFGGALVTKDEALYRLIDQQIKAYPQFKAKDFLKKVSFALMTDISTLPILFQAITYPIFRYAYLNKIEKIDNLVVVDKFPQRKSCIPDSLLVQMTAVQAKLILKQLDTTAVNNAARLKAASTYAAGLCDLTDVVLPPLCTDQSHIYTYYPIQVPDRHALLRFAYQHRRDLVLSHYHNCADLEIFADFYRDCPNARKTSHQLLYLPTYPRYRHAEIEKNIKFIRHFFGKS